MKTQDERPLELATALADDLLNEVISRDLDAWIRQQEADRQFAETAPLFLV